MTQDFRTPPPPLFYSRISQKKSQPPIFSTSEKKKKKAGRFFGGFLQAGRFHACFCMVGQNVAEKLFDSDTWIPKKGGLRGGFFGRWYAPNRLMFHFSQGRFCRYLSWPHNMAMSNTHPSPLFLSLFFPSFPKLYNSISQISPAWLHRSPGGKGRNLQGLTELRFFWCCLCVVCVPGWGWGVWGWRGGCGGSCGQGRKKRKLGFSSGGGS